MKIEQLFEEVESRQPQQSSSLISVGNEAQWGVLSAPNGIVTGNAIWNYKRCKKLLLYRGLDR